MEHRNIDNATVRAFMERNLPGEGIYVDDVHQRWNRNDFTDEEIAWVKTYLEEHGMPAEQYYGQNLQK